VRPEEPLHDLRLRPQLLSQLRLLPETTVARLPLAAGEVVDAAQQLSRYERPESITLVRFIVQPTPPTPGAVLHLRALLLVATTMAPTSFPALRHSHGSVRVCTALDSLATCRAQWGWLFFFFSFPFLLCFSFCVRRYFCCGVYFTTWYQH
jgi:hypothetical protein